MIPFEFKVIPAGRFWNVEAPGISFHEYPNGNGELEAKGTPPVAVRRYPLGALKSLSNLPSWGSVKGPLMTGGTVELIVCVIVMESLRISLDPTLVETLKITEKFPDFVGFPEYFPLESILSPGGAPIALHEMLGSVCITWSDENITSG